QKGIRQNGSTAPGPPARGSAIGSKGSASHAWNARHRCAVPDPAVQAGYTHDGVRPTCVAPAPAPPWPPSETTIVKQSLDLVSLVVRDYDEAIDFFIGKLGFRLVEDTPVPEQSKRWVVVSPPGATESRLLLARATTPDQETRIGGQTGGRVFLFLHTR